MVRFRSKCALAKFVHAVDYWDAGVASTSGFFLLCSGKGLQNMGCDAPLSLRPASRLLLHPERHAALSEVVAMDDDFIDDLLAQTLRSELDRLGEVMVCFAAPLEPGHARPVQG